MLSIFCGSFDVLVEAGTNGAEEAGMARHGTISRSSQSIVGATLVGLGIFLLYENLAGAVAWLSQVLGANGLETLGVPAAFVLTASQAAHCCSRDRHWVLQSLLPQILVSSWPLLLVTFGRVLSRDTLTEKSTHVEENNPAPVDARSSR